MNQNMFPGNTVLVHPPTPPQNPPTHLNVGRAIDYLCRVRKRHELNLSAQDDIDTEIGQISVYQHLLQQRLVADMYPPVPPPPPPPPPPFDMNAVVQAFFAAPDWVHMRNQVQNLSGRMDGVEHQLGAIHDRLNVIDERLDGIDERLDRLDERLDRLDERLGFVESISARNYNSGCDDGFILEFFPVPASRPHGYVSPPLDYYRLSDITAIRNIDDLSLNEWLDFYGLPLHHFYVLALGAADQ
ncbi:hypothetical protein VNI00_002392 [Paramarasmius palmivorus]|uniref:Uncharacterized protein n=1 Tax=Paramarasmius palmivorus TaxID=297713 RepID=A0AAW0DY12_9AGAR